VKFSVVRGELDINATLSVYHFLKDRLEYNPALNGRYRRFVGGKGLDINSAKRFVDILPHSAGIYSHGDPITANSYNEDCLLSQSIQYVFWTDLTGPHILLQIHNGADIRGGYTDPVAFDLHDEDETAIFDYTVASIVCSVCKHRWTTDDATHWYDACESEGLHLEEYAAVSEKPVYLQKPNPEQKMLPIELPDRPEPRLDVVWVDDDGNGHCPYCGGILEAK
jgi:hypothetical protein